jgi:predicted transposase YbfD/YdcC
MNNLQRLRLESAAVEFPDYIRDFKKLQMILQKHNYLDCSELNILSIESLQFYFRDNLSNRNNLEYMFFYKYVLRSVAETHWDDGFDTYYFFYSDTEEPPIRQKDIVNYNKAFGDTTFYSFYRNKNEGKNVDPELLLEGMTFKGTPIGIWNIRDKKYDFTDGFSITKLDYGKSIIQKDEFTFFSYIKENATLKKNDEFVASLTLYHEKCFYSGNKAYKDILSSFLKTGETNFVNTEYVFSVNKESSFLLYENGLANGIRKHWGIENKVHWILDVAFNEDYSRKRNENSAQNYSCLNRIALNILKQDKLIKRGIKGKRLNAAWNNKYLLELLENI